MIKVEAIELVKRYGQTLAVDRASITADKGEFITILGPSGCGKSTTLRMIAGLITPDAGRIFFDGKDVTGLPPEKRNIGFVFQRVALFPHMNVFKNVAFGLQMRKYPKSEIKSRVSEVLRLVRMEGFEERMPSQLSGGQAQRVEIARVLATDPAVLLFDEPLSNIDAKLRDELKYEIRRIQKETGKTTIYVTHDQSEAFAISDRIYVMNSGRIEQVGTPYELYTNPRTPFVAAFIGSSNFIEVRVIGYQEESSTTLVRAGNVTLRVRGGPLLSEGSKIILLLRPEDIYLLDENHPAEAEYLNVLKGRVESVTFVGTFVRVNFDVDGLSFKVDVHGEDRFRALRMQGKEALIGFSRCTILNIP